MSILGEKPLSKSQDGIKIKHRRNIRRSSQDVRYDVQYNQPKKEMINIGDCELIDIRTDQWRFLSINHELPFEENGISFSCINRYIIYQKNLLFKSSTNDEHLNNILTMPIGQVIARYLFPNQFNNEIWIEHSYDIIRNAFILKLSKYPELKNKLKETGDKTLYYVGLDRIWGIGYSINEVNYWHPVNYGRNLQGLCLMEVRAILS